MPPVGCAGPSETQEGPAERRDSMDDLDHLSDLLGRRTAEFEAERLLLDASELVSGLMEDGGVAREELAQRVGRSKSSVSRLLDGRDVTLRALAEVLHALGYRCRITAESSTEGVEDPHRVGDDREDVMSVKDAARLRRMGVRTADPPSPWDGPWMRVDDLGWELPALVLTADLPPRARLKPGREWVALAHQHGGVSCSQLRVVATRLEWRREALEVFADVTASRYGSNIGAGGLSLSEASAYEEEIRSKLGVTCDRSWRSLSEAVYPVDPTPEAFAAMTVDLDVRAEALDDLAVWPSPVDRLVGITGRWGLLVLAHNSD